MAWNGSGSAATSAAMNKKIAKPRKASSGAPMSGAFKGTLALILVLAIGAGAYWFTTSDEVKAKVVEKLPKKQIAEVEADIAENTSNNEVKNCLDESAPDQSIAKKRIAQPIDRKQIYGSERRMEESIAAGNRNIFRHTSESFMAMYAIPGEAIPPMPRFPNFNDDVAAALIDPITIEDEDTEEDIQLKEIVAGMKEELKEFIKDGGTVDEYFDALESRQLKEAEYYQEIHTMVWDAVKGRDGGEGNPQEAYETWKTLNKHLTEKGIRTVPLPRPLWKQFKDKTE